MPTSLGPVADKVLEALTSGAVVVDAAGVVVLSNAAARTMGIPTGRPLADSDLQELVEKARTTQRVHEAEVEMELPPGPGLRFPRRGRESLPVLAQVTPLGDDPRVVIILDDLTEARRVERVRKDFVANVSHELKTPVGALALLAEAIGQASDDPEAVRRFSGRILRESGRLSRLVQEIIDLSRLEGADPLPEPKDVRLRSVVREALDRNRMAAEENQIRIVRVLEEDAWVRGDEQQLVTAVENLVENAIAYSPPSTSVTVGLRRTESVVEISVADEGIGIAEHERERVFERFYRSDPARSRATGGTGLGLAIVKHVATAHGGGVSLWSQEGSGSTFTLTLPALDRPAAAGKAKEATA